MVTINRTTSYLVIAAAKSDGERRFWKVNSSAVIVNTGNGQPARSVSRLQPLCSSRKETDQTVIQEVDSVRVCVCVHVRPRARAFRSKQCW